MTAEVSQPEGTPVRMPPITITYQELVTIRTQLVDLNGKFNATLALTGRVDGLEKRVGSVETQLAGRAGEQRTWNTIFAYAAGVVTMALGGGAVQYLPKLLGWHLH